MILSEVTRLSKLSAVIAIGLSMQNSPLSPLSERVGVRRRVGAEAHE